MSVDNGWTGGQYSLFRVVFGGYLFVHFLQLIPWGPELFSSRGVLPDGSRSPILYLFPNVLALWDSPPFVTALLVGAAGLSLLLLVGVYDRIAAVLLWYIWACVFGRNPLISNPSLPYVGWMLLAHAFLPPAPYGSLARRGRSDPGASWRMPQGIFVAAWILMGLGYSYSGFTKLMSPSWVDGSAIARVLENPLARPGPLREAVLAMPAWFLRLNTWFALGLELSFAPLALIPRLRPLLWSLLLAMHLGLMALVDFAELSLGMVMLHLFTFNPRWVRPLNASAPEMIFYDGHCGLCHRLVRFVLAEDQRGDSFRFAPLDSDHFRRVASETGATNLPDSIVVRTIDGALLTRSAAVLHILRRLGGVWRLAAGVSGIVPVQMRDWLYDGVARIRHRLFRPPSDACPLVPRDLRARFEV